MFVYLLVPIGWPYWTIQKTRPLKHVRQCDERAGRRINNSADCPSVVSPGKRTHQAATRLRGVVLECPSKYRLIRIPRTYSPTRVLVGRTASSDHGERVQRQGQTEPSARTPPSTGASSDRSTTTARVNVQPSATNTNNTGSGTHRTGHQPSKTKPRQTSGTPGQQTHLLYIFINF